jgi:class 3 adenylate cyclase
MWHGRWYADNLGPGEVGLRMDWAGSGARPRRRPAQLAGGLGSCRLPGLGWRWLGAGGFDRGSGCLQVAGWRRGGRPMVVVRAAAGDGLGGRGVSEFPSGTVTFLFTDIEGSTRLVKALRERYPRVLAEHQRLVRAAIAAYAGHEVDTQGDAFFAAFAGAKQAVLCALEIQRALAAHEWPAGAPVRVRIGVHTGQAVPDGGDYTGLAVHRAARICTAARGGQVLVSQATQDIIEDEEEEPGFTLVDLGERTLKDLDRPVRVFELAAPGLEARDSSAAAQPGGGAAAAARTLPGDLDGRRDAGGTSACEVRLLGAVQVVRAGCEVGLGGPRPRAVLALLVLEAGRVVPAERLVEEIWRGSPPPGAAKTLRSYISRLRALLSPDAALAARGGGYVLSVDPDRVDAVRFERLADAGQAALGGGEAAAAAGRFRQALGDLPRAFRTADLRLIHAADCCSRYSSWTCRGVRY